MHQLDRPETPHCLNKYNYRHHSWDSTHPDNSDREILRDILMQMQGMRCAYCECNIGTVSNGNKSHFEHFAKRSTHRERTFEWQNLFLSCNNDSSCGKFKDNKAGIFNPDVLIKPDNDNPDDYFRFYSDGVIRIREGLSEVEQFRAKETLRVFNLNGALRKRREDAISPYKNTLQAVKDLISEHDLPLVLEFINEILNDIKNQPFETAIRHQLVLIQGIQ